MSAVRRLVRVASPLAALGVWQLLTSYDVQLWLRFEQFPTVVEVASALADRVGTEAYWQDLGHSLRRIAVGFLLAAVLGVAAGTAVARSRWAADILGPLVEVVRPIPAIALVPVAILLLPTNEQGIVFITCAAALFPVLVSTRHAVRALNPAWEEAVLTLGGGRARVLFSVVLPGALPGIFGGLSVGIGVSWICVISAEMISGEYGVGYRTWQDYTVVDHRVAHGPVPGGGPRAGPGEPGADPGDEQQVEDPVEDDALAGFVAGDLLVEEGHQGAVPHVRGQVEHARQGVEQPPADLTVHPVGADEDRGAAVGGVAPGADAEPHGLGQRLPAEGGAGAVRADPGARRGVRGVGDGVRLRAAGDGDVTGPQQDGLPGVGDDPGLALGDAHQAERGAVLDPYGPRRLHDHAEQEGAPGAGSVEESGECVHGPQA